MKNIEQCKQNIKEFAERFDLIFVEEGEVGIGRECVGISDGDSYVSYNPTKHDEYEPIKEFFDERLYKITPKHAYHKFQCLAVLGRGEGPIRELSDWVDKLNELGVTVVKYETGADEEQAYWTGDTNYTVKVIGVQNV